MKSLHELKSQESARLAADYAAWLKAGHRPEILPSPGSGHILTNTYSLKQKSNDEYAKKGKYKGISHD